MSLYKAVLPALLIMPWNADYTDSFQNAGNASDRCVTSNCTCRVSMPPSTQIVRFQNRSQGQVSVYFDENSSSVDSESRRSVSEMINQSEEENTFFVVGYADGCGSYSYNRSLSESRAARVASHIRSIRPDASLVQIGMSELTNTHSDSARRVDVFTERSRLSLDVNPNLTADFYLIDYSGSMSNKAQLARSVIAAGMKSSSKIYISYSEHCYNGQRLDMIPPRGATEIWYSYWWILDRMSPGQTLIIFSDFDSRIPLTPAESRIISAKVESKGVTVYGISL